MKNLENQKTLDKQGKMTAQGGKHTRKYSDNESVQKKRKTFSSSKKLTTENFEFVWAKKEETDMKKKRVKK